MIKVCEEPLVSVIIPVFNAERFLRETIQSVLDQTYINWELILVNDCSTDGSELVARQFLEDERIKWINLKDNSGVAMARNKGVKLARGRFVAFLDADDLFVRDKLKKQVEFMLEKDCAFSFTSYEFADADGKPNGKKVIVPPSITHRQALKNTTIFTSTVMLDIYKISKEDIEMPNIPSEDTATWWKILEKVPCGYGMSDIYSYYRRSVGTLSSNKIEAVRRIWNLYRNVERMNMAQSAYCFCFWAFNAVRRRV